MQAYKWYGLAAARGHDAARRNLPVATVGFPNIGLQGFAPKLARGQIASLSGPQDDPRYFRIRVPVEARVKSAEQAAALVLVH